MTEDDLLQKLKAALEDSRGASARQLANLLGVRSRDVNPVLYKHKGTAFVVVPGAPPTWRSADLKQIDQSPKTVLLARSTSESSHEVFLKGNAWQVHLQVSRTSRNDPAFCVESLGGRERIISVSVHVLSDEHSLQSLEEGLIPDAVYALASAALVNEAFAKEGFHPADDSEFPNAVTEVLLQFAADARRTTNPK